MSGDKGGVRGQSAAGFATAAVPATAARPDRFVHRSAEIEVDPAIEADAEPQGHDVGDVDQTPNDVDPPSAEFGKR